MSYLLVNILNAYLIIIFIRVVFSWIRPRNVTSFHLFIYKVTEPVLQPVRKVIPPIGGTIDISPIIVLFLIGIIKRFLMV